MATIPNRTDVTHDPASETVPLVVGSGAGRKSVIAMVLANSETMTSAAKFDPSGGDEITMTQMFGGAINEGALNAYMYECDIGDGVSADTYNLQYFKSGGSPNHKCMAWQLAGCATGTPAAPQYDYETVGDGVQATIAGTVTTVTDDVVLTALFVNTTVATVSSLASGEMSMTNQDEEATGFRGVQGDGVADGSESVTVTWTMSGTQAAKIGLFACFKTAASGLSIPIAMRHYLNMGNN